MELFLANDCMVGGLLLPFGFPLTTIDIIREWQAKHLYDEYKLSNLHVFRSKISKSFNHQVLATWVARWS